MSKTKVAPDSRDAYDLVTLELTSAHAIATLLHEQQNGDPETTRAGYLVTEHLERALDAIRNHLNPYARVGSEEHEPASPAAAPNVTRRLPSWGRRSREAPDLFRVEPGVPVEEAAGFMLGQLEGLEERLSVAVGVPIPIESAEAALLRQSVQQMMAVCEAMGAP